MMDIVQTMTKEDGQGTSLENPQVAAAWVGMFTDALPSFYIEHLKRLRKSGIQPYFMLAHVHQLEIVERLIRQGFYMGPLNHNLTSIGGGACGRNPFDWMEYLRRSPQGSVLHFQNSMRGNYPMHAMAMALGAHIRLGIEDNIWRKKGERFTTLQQIEWVTTLAKHMGREIATPEEARAMMKIGTWYDSVDETLQELGLPPNRKGGQVGFLGYGKNGAGLIGNHPQAGDSHPMFEGIPEGVTAGAAPKI